MNHYRDNPGIGLRELIQNAIDAVREFDFIAKEMPISKSIDREELDGDVVIEFEQDTNGDYWIKVADRGIGMTWQTVCKYYLTAGASFRQSGAWKKRFTDDSGESQVLRSGRFGIGVLAAFLLGDRVYVSTRHIEEPEDKGIEFEFGLDDTTIELRWEKRQVGTTVKVRTTEEIVKELKEREYYGGPKRWDWYFLEKPTLVVKDLDGTPLNSKYKMPGFEDKLPADWHCIKVPGLQAVNWTYGWAVPDLTCNGILIGAEEVNIQEQFRITLSHRPRPRLRLANPKVSVFDPDGRFPLNLARDSLAREPVELKSQLADDVSRNFIAFSLYRGPKARLLSDNNFSVYKNIEYPGLSNYTGRDTCYFDTPNGFGLSDPWSISQFNSSPGLLLRIQGNTFKTSEDMDDLVKRSYGYTYGMQSDATLTRFDAWSRSLVLSHGGFEPLPIYEGLIVKGFRVIMSDFWYNRFIEKQPKFVVNLHQVKVKKQHWVIFTIGDCPDGGDKLFSLAKNLVDNKVSIESLVECYLSSEDESPEPGRIAKIWKEAIGGPIIPFDMEERQHIIENLDEKFKCHLEQWSSEKKVRLRRR